MLILLTNDDGITAPGLLAAYRELIKLGEVHVIAPETVQSAAGHGITLKSPLLTSQVKVGNDFEGIAVDGRPADCVKLALTELLPKTPDLVVSGINSGANVGINVIYSGTVAAAIEAAFLGVPAVALSLYLRKDTPTDYPRAASFSRDVIEQLLSRGLSKGDVVSVNLPALLPQEQPAGIKVVRQCTRAWADTYDRREDPRGRPYFWNTAIFSLETDEPDSDVAALRDKHITITPLHFDLTQYKLLGKWNEKPWPLPENA
jgi:5'-nucleotidase